MVVEEADGIYAVAGAEGRGYEGWVAVGGQAVDVGVLGRGEVSGGGKIADGGGGGWEDQVVGERVSEARVDRGGKDAGKGGEVKKVPQQDVEPTVAPSRPHHSIYVHREKRPESTHPGTLYHLYRSPGPVFHLHSFPMSCLRPPVG